MDEKRRLRWIVVLTGIGSFMAALDTLVVASALNTIQRDLGASLTDLEWTVNAYNLSLAVLLVPAAVLGDRLGRARTYAAGLALFALTSAGAALAGSVEVLVAMRVLQGAAAAIVMTLGLALLSSAFPPEKRGAAVGLFSAVTGVAVACGPLVGGAVVEGLPWQWIFWLNVPVGLLAAPLVLRLVPEAKVPDSRLDLWGVVLLGSGVLGVVWAVVRGEDAGWTSPDGAGPRRCRRRAARRVRRVGAPGAVPPAPAAAAPRPRLHGRQPRGRADRRAAVLGGVLLRTAAPGGHGPRRARSGGPADGVDRHAPAGGPGRRRPGRPDRGAPADRRRARPAGRRPCCGSPSSSTST